MAASAAMPAVSARNTFGPRFHGRQPKPVSISRSRSAQPPSGPSSSATLSPPRIDNRVSGGPCRISSSKTLCVDSVSAASRNFTGSSMTGSVIRRHCWLASKRIRSHRSFRFGAAWSSPRSLRSAITGTIRATFNSVAFSSSHSKWSNLNRLASRVTSGTGAWSGNLSVTLKMTELFRAVVTVAK